MPDDKLTPEQIAGYVIGELDPAQRDAVARLLENAAARQLVERYRTILAAARADDSLQPPTHLIKRAKALFAAHAPIGQKIRDLMENLRRVVADLTFDSRPQAALAGLRGAATAYQLGYESEVAEIDLDVTPIPESPAVRRLTGQVTLRDAAGQRIGAVTLVQPGTTTVVAAATPDDHGVLTVTAEAGTYDVLIALPDACVVLPGVEIR
jgi:anti-sigma factor RsiW